MYFCSMKIEKILQIAVRMAVSYVMCILMSVMVLPLMANFNHNSPYISYNTGTCSVIFSVPHGGNDQPDSIPDRTVCGSNNYRGCLLSDGTCMYSHHPDYSPEYCNCEQGDNTCKVSYIIDSFTQEIAVSVRNELYNLTGKKSFIIINNLKRNRMDGNRDKPEATFGVHEAEDAWETYHERILAAITSTESHGPVLYIGFHGQTHREGWTELGYGLRKSELNDLSPEELLNQHNTTICKLVNRHCNNRNNNWRCFDDLLRGQNSLGHFLQEELDENRHNYVTVPSPGNPSPGVGRYYPGGYIVRRYGGCRDNQVDGIQIEMPSKQRWEEKSRNHYIKALARAIKAFLDTNFPSWKE